MGKFPELRASAKEVMSLIDEVVVEANQMDPKDLEPFLPRKKEKPKEDVVKELPTLQNSDKVVLRFAPGPSGPLHLVVIVVLFVVVLVALAVFVIDMQVS